MEHLLEEFPPVSTAEWETAIARDLKGADYEKRLIWRSEEGLAVKPYYRAEDLKDLACMDAAPGAFPYRRGARATGDWRIREEIDASNAETANLRGMRRGCCRRRRNCIQQPFGRRRC